MATDFRLKDQLPKTHAADRADVRRGRQDQPLGPLPAAELRRDHRRHGRPEGDPFPGYRRRERLHAATWRTTWATWSTGCTIDSRSRSAAHCGTKRARPTIATRDQDYEALGQAKTMLFLERLPEVRKMLATDVQAAYDGDPACKRSTK